MRPIGPAGGAGYASGGGEGKLCKYRQLKVFRLIGATQGKRLRLLLVIERNENNRSIEF